LFKMKLDQVIKDDKKEKLFGGVKAGDIDRVICAEISDKEKDPELFQLVSDFMIHDSCGVNNPTCSCMRDVEKGRIAFDNRYVVPYNNLLLKRYQAHFNVEWCNQSGAIKYLFKYINKGPDRVIDVVFEGNNDESVHGIEANVDEIKEYYNCRYISACEATWRIFSFDIHYRYPFVERLSFHLPSEQNIIYEDDDDDLCDVLNKPIVGLSMFMA
nr:hypothetical protein [Tanacetum cinerariifolium]